MLHPPLFGFCCLFFLLLLVTRLVRRCTYDLVSLVTVRVLGLLVIIPIRRYPKFFTVDVDLAALIGQGAYNIAYLRQLLYIVIVAIVAIGIELAVFTGNLVSHAAIIFGYRLIINTVSLIILLTIDLDRLRIGGQCCYFSANRRLNYGILTVIIGIEEAVIVVIRHIIIIE